MTNETYYEDMNYRDIQKLKNLKPREDVHDESWRAAQEYNCIQHLKRLQEMINHYNKVNGTNISMNSVKVYKPPYSLQLQQEGSQVSYVSADPRIIEAANQSTRERYFNNMIASGPTIPTPRKGSVNEREWANVIESLRSAQGDADFQKKLTMDAMKDTKKFQPQYDDATLDDSVTLTASGKKYRADRGLPDQTTPQYTAYDSTMVMKFADKVAFEVWYSQNSNVRLLSNPEINPDDGSITIKVSSAYINATGTNMTSGTRAGGPWTSPTRTR